MANRGDTIDRHELESDNVADAAAVQNLSTASPERYCVSSTSSVLFKDRQIAREDLLASSPAAIPITSITPSNMIFSDLYRSPRSHLSKLRSLQPQLPAHLTNTVPGWGTDEYADLLSKDKAKQKVAVRKYLTDKIRSDWTFSWAPPKPLEKASAKAGRQARGSATSRGQEEPLQEGVQDTDDLQENESDDDDGDVHIDDDNDDAESIYSVVSEDTLHYRPRVEWDSDFSDDDDRHDAPTKTSPIRFDGTKSSHPTAFDAAQERKAGRRRALREEMTWNDGLACFEARRDAWTGAKTVRVRGKPSTSLSASPRSPRRFFFRRSMSTSPTDSTLAALSHQQDSAMAVSDTSSSLSKSLSKEVDASLRKHNSIDSSTTTTASVHSQLHPVEVLVPIGQPLLPPHNPLRATISPSVYLNLYDKVVQQGLQPACPINLSDMLRSCVAGWKRDGEWPPRSSAPALAAAVRRKKKDASVANDQAGSVARRMSFGLLGRDHCGDDSNAGKGIRRSLQRALGIGATEG